MIAQTSHPKNRLAGQKTASGIFCDFAAEARPETLPQTLGTHLECVTYIFKNASGCAVGPYSGFDAFSSVGDNSKIDGKFTESEFRAAIEIIKKTEPKFYAYMKANYRLFQYGNENKPELRKASGYRIGVAIYINMDFTLAYLNFDGTAAQFLASVILHEATHIGYAAMGYPSSIISPQNEASVRYWVEDWAIRHNIPETTPGARAFGGKNPDFNQILRDVQRDGYGKKSF